MAPPIPTVCGTRLRRLLPDTESVALSLPGFGCPIPTGFTATKEE